MHALAHLDLIGPQMMGMGQGGLPSIHFLITLCHFAVSGTLHRLFPSVFGQPAMLSLASRPVPYSRIFWVRHRDFAIALAGLAGAITLLAEVVRWFIM